MGVRKLLLRPVELVRGGIAFGDGKFSDIIISKSSVETDLSERQTKNGSENVASQRESRAQTTGVLCGGDRVGDCCLRVGFFPGAAVPITCYLLPVVQNIVSSVPT